MDTADYPDYPDSGCHSEDDVKKQKLIASLSAGGLFAVLSAPAVYKITNNAMSKVSDIQLADYDGCPTAAGLLVHGLVYLLITRWAMNYEPKGCVRPYSAKDKWIFSAMGAALFIMLSSPFAYQLTQSVSSMLNIDFSNSYGCPTTTGLLVHSAVDALVIRLLMR